ncbi:hypothetical protein [Segetibacter aerophilus]|uniref:Uncharacterized protein n=1 Tax=Segetibacter aerophilus TaxID=670293 RepID=A0A512BA54_9BACT|nr:hypothetical protein [Segetibacter aerophilus]GEO08707.1 hypothetical protein SAE01_12030 [Segetibacter aerophilus]
MTLFEKVERLQLVKKIVDRVELGSVVDNGVKTRVILDHDEFLKALDLIQQIDAFHEFVTTFSKYNLTLTGGLLHEKSSGEFKDALVSLSKLVDALYVELAKIAGEPKAEDILIKLPPISDFKDLSKTSDVFDKILSQAIINSTINGQVVIEGVENGSIWMKVYVGSLTAVSLIGGLTWSAAVANKKYQESRYIEQLVRQQDLQNDQKELMIKVQQQTTQMLIDAEAVHLYHEYFKTGDSDPDQINRLKLSVKLLAEEISKGAEVIPALAAPEDVKNLFPDMKNLPGVESRIKQIDDKK